jgi:hypothetical protein
MATGPTPSAKARTVRGDRLVPGCEAGDEGISSQHRIADMPVKNAIPSTALFYIGPSCLKDVDAANFARLLPPPITGAYKNSCNSV